MVNRKIIGFGLLLISLIILLVYLTAPEEKILSEDIRFYDNNQVITSINTNYVDTLVRAGLQVLEIDSVIVFVNPFNENVRRKINKLNDLDVHALIEGDGDVYYIYLKDLSTNRTIKVLSHELIHLEQKIRGDLTIVENGYEWKGNFYPSDFDYNKRPWENEAFNREREIKKDIEKIIYK